MAVITKQQLNEIRSRPGYETIATAVETGTFEARTSRLLREVFQTVHTIELQPERWAQCVDLYAKMGIQFHIGDSLTILPAIARAYRSRPCLWFLDAHWFDLAGHGDDWPIPVAGESPFPLWGELVAILARKQADIVIVDDVHAFGRQDNGWHSVSKQTLDIAIGSRLEDSRIETDFYVAWLKGRP